MRVTPPLRPYPERPGSRASRGPSRLSRTTEDDRRSPEVTLRDSPESRAETPMRPESRHAHDELLSKTQQVSHLQFAVREQEEIALRCPSRAEATPEGLSSLPLSTALEKQAAT